jgi:hypothetical protein
LDHRRSTSGYVFNLFGGEIRWMRKIQAVVALSTTEVEYVAATHASKEAVSLLHLGQIPMVCSTQLPLSIVRRSTNLGPPQTSFHMTSFFQRQCFRLYCDVSNMARETLQTWQDRRFKRGKRDIANVARPTFQTWQLRRCKRSKRDVTNVERPMFQTWQLRHCKRGK